MINDTFEFDLGCEFERLKMVLVDVILKRMVELNMDGEDLAKAAHIRPIVIHHLLDRDEANVSIGTLARIALGLGTRVNLKLEPIRHD